MFSLLLQVGDLIGIAGNHWNGYGRGTNKRTNMVSTFNNIQLLHYSA